MTLFERHWRAILVGFVAAALGGLATLGLDDSDSTIFAGVALSAIGGVYLGFAIADGRTSAIAIQATSMLAFAIVAYVGIEEGRRRSSAPAGSPMASGIRSITSTTARPR